VGFSLQNSIVANSINGGECDTAGGISSDANRIIKDGSSNAAGIGARAVDPRPAPLMDNGGLSNTMALHSGTMAINSGNNAICQAFDRRGTERPRSDANGCDVGAFELSGGIFFVVPLPSGKAVIF